MSLVKSKSGKATVSLKREANSSTYEIGMGRDFPRGNRSGMLGQRSWGTCEILPGLVADVLVTREDPFYKATPKGTGSREEVGQGHSSVDRRDNITRRERRTLTLAALNLKDGIGDCR